MTYVRNCIFKLVLLVCCYFHVNNATTEKLETIFLRLYTGNDVEDYVDANLREAKSLISNFDIHIPTVIYIHGFTESVNSTSVLTVVNAYLNRMDHNVLAVDWSVIARRNYINVAFNVGSVGAFIARALNDIVSEGFPSENVHVVGHSIGAHVAAYVGRNVDFSLERITGLDPAGPLFNFLGPYLSRKDAKFVDIIHTDLGFYGNARTSGSVDFFPNGGRRIQPGCPSRFALYSSGDFCSHHRSWIFYSESVTMEKAFLAIKCSEPGSSRVIMGYATPTNAKGSYCLVTNSSAPYGLGKEGATES